jgi:hypothetical protein
MNILRESRVVGVIAIYRQLRAGFRVAKGFRLERMKLHAGSQSRDEPYRQEHGGDYPSPAAFDFGHLEFAAGDCAGHGAGSTSMPARSCHVCASVLARTASVLRGDAKIRVHDRNSNPLPLP